MRDGAVDVGPVEVQSEGWAVRGVADAALEECVRFHGGFDSLHPLHSYILRSERSTAPISGWYLSDNPDNPRKWVFPEGSVIAANSFLIVWANEDGKAPEGLHANFKLSSYGESVLLSSLDETSRI